MENDLQLRVGQALTENQQLIELREENILARFIRLERKSAEHSRDIAEIKRQLEELKKQR